MRNFPNSTTKHFYQSIFFVVIISIGLCNNVVEVSAKTFWGDILVLKQLKQSIVPSSVSSGSCVASWDFSVDPCDSLSSENFTCGFTCDIVLHPRNNVNISRVTQLALDQAGYSAQLAAVSWNLPFLNSLDLSGNDFFGPIPDSFSGLIRLTKLTLSHNSLSGRLPDSLSRLGLLEEVYLDNNAFVGPISPGFSGLVKLKRFEVQGNQLSGELPDLSRLSSLVFFDCSDNSISGEFPASFPANIVEVSMRNNSLIGGLREESVSKLGFLQVLDLSYNQLAGSVPASLLTHPRLQQLSLACNNFTAIEVPSQLGTDSGLIAIDLSRNQLGGFIPGFMGIMPRLSSLSLENNKLTGFIPTQIALKTIWPASGIASFDRLLLGGNFLFGPIPGPLMRLEPGSVHVNLADNCLFVCPITLFFCQGGDQKSLVECRNSIGPIIP